MPQIKPIRGARVLSSNPYSDFLGCWLINEGVGSLVADSRRNHGGVLFGDAVRVSSDHGGAISLGDTTGYMRIDNTLDLQPDHMTFIIWFVRKVALSGTQILADFGREGSNDAFQIRYDTGKLQGILSAPGGLNIAEYADEDAVTPIGQLVMVSLTWDGVTLKLYAGADLLDSVSTNPGPMESGTTRDFGFGATGAGGNPLGCEVDSAFLFPRALCRSSLRSLCRRPFQMFEPNTPLGTYGYLIPTFSASGSVNAAASLSGAVTVTQSAVGSVNASSSLSGSLSITNMMEGSVNAASSVTGTLYGNLQISGTVNALAALSGSVQTALPLYGQISAVTTLSGMIELPVGGSVLPDEWLWVQELIEDEGRELTLTTPGDENDLNKPWRGNASDQVILTTGVFVRYRSTEVDGDHIRRGDQKVLVVPDRYDNVEVATKVRDSLDASSWTVVRVQKISYKSDIILYILQVRQ